MKGKFIKSTIILIIGGLLTKILGMFIRIITTRIIGLDAIGLFMLVMPTYGLFITIATLSIPVAVSKLVSEETRNNKNVVLGTIPIILVFNLLVILILIFSSGFISNTLLQNDKLYYPILAISTTLPFVALSSIIRGYFFGKQKMIPHVISNLFEQIIRLIMTLIITPYLLPFGNVAIVTGLVLFNIVSELCSILILFLFIPKNMKISKSDLIPNHATIRDIFSISIPTTAGRIVNSVGNFLEPIIITFVLISIGYNNDYITKEYGIISGYIFPIVMLPQFLSGAISSALLPTISYYSTKNMYFSIKRKMYQAIAISLFIGTCFTVLFMIFPKTCLTLMFDFSEGYKYLMIAAPIFLITYIQAPIVSTLQAVGEAKVVMNSNLIGLVVKTIALFLLLYLDIDMFALLFSIFIQYFIITLYQYNKIKLYLKKTN